MDLPNTILSELMTKDLVFKEHSQLYVYQRGYLEGARELYRILYRESGTPTDQCLFENLRRDGTAELKVWKEVAQEANQKISELLQENAELKAKLTQQSEVREEYPC